MDPTQRKNNSSEAWAFAPPRAHIAIFGLPGSSTLNVDPRHSLLAPAWAQPSASQ